jgi:peptidoglycan/LPS O-acetylase OafA/YrhL
MNTTSIIKNDSALGQAKKSNLAPLLHLSALDGFRGLLAMWVYLGHLSNAVGFKNYVLGMHALAVDLFMILSGFLMVYTWKTVISIEHNFSFSLRHNAYPFYANRFFRIAPLYYLLLLVCYCFLPELAEMHDYAQKLIPPPWAEKIANFNPQTLWDFASFKWLFLHGTFTFGAIPGMESTTPLPDWSLSLEMQFYLIMPLLLLLLGRMPIILLAIITAVLALNAPSLFGSYLNPGSIAHFGQPSFIAFRLNAFMAGMVVAFWLRDSQLSKPSLKTNVFTVLSGLICILPLSKPVILGYVIFVVLVLYRVPSLNKVLSIKPLRFLGDVSYSLYLSHLLIVIPVVYWLIQQPDFMSLSSLMRFGLATGITSPLVILVSYILFRGIEIPSIRLGKYFLSRSAVLIRYRNQDDSLLR